MNVWHGLRIGAAIAAFVAPLVAQGNPASAPAAGQGRGGAPPAAAGRGGGPGLALTSADFEDGGVIANTFTQVEQNYRSPALSWTNVPANTQSFALIMTDVDVAPMRGSEPFVHWVVFNIPGNARGFVQGITAEAANDIVQGRNGRGTSAYLGPGAPAGPYHHYIFELFALDTRLNLTSTATRAEVMAAMNGHVIGKAALTGRFHR